MAVLGLLEDSLMEDQERVHETLSKTQGSSLRNSEQQLSWIAQRSEVSLSPKEALPLIGLKLQEA